MYVCGVATASASISDPRAGYGGRGSSAGMSAGLVEFVINSLIELTFKVSCRALILARLGHLMPTWRIDTKPFSDLLDLELADPSFHEPGSIDVILGADLHGSLLHGEIVQSAIGAPVAQSTQLGWVIYGRFPQEETREACTRVSHVELADLVQCMWKFNENEGVEETVQRTSSGRYVVKYPFKESVDLTMLADSRGDSLKLLHHQLRRLDNNIAMTLYQEFILEYQLLGLMESVYEEETPQSVCYIPHHGVYKEFSSSTKLRVVLNAARKYAQGMSLNECLHVGPKLQRDLTAIILKWRTHRIGFMEDIEKCYRQILVQRDDADMQRIMWTDTEGLPAVIRLLTVTYGLNCSLYLTIKVLQTLADDEEAHFPVAAQVLRESFYMDDCLHGTDSVETAQQLQEDLQMLLERGGFLLRKWNSNSSELIETCCELYMDRETKALGIYWFCESDCIGYKVNVTRVSSAFTKRQQLSDVAKIYDPTCLLAPVIVLGKIMCQQLWLTGISWNDPLPEPQQQNWIRFREELTLIDDIKVPRWVFSSPDVLNYQLHVFSDASTNAYAAVTYLRVKTVNGEVKVSIFMAKTKITLLKKIVWNSSKLQLSAGLTRRRLSAEFGRILDNIRRKPDYKNTRAY